MRTEKGSFKEFYSIVRFLLPDFKKFIINRSFVSLFYEGLKLVPVYLVKLIIDEVVINQDIKQAAILSAIMFGILTLLITIEMISYKYVLKRVANFQKNVLERIHKKLLHLPLSFHEKQSTGSMVSKINRASNYLSDLVWYTNNEIMPTFFQITLTSILLISTEWRIGLMYLISLPFVISYILKNGKKMQPYREKYHKLFDAASGELAQTLYNVRTVKDYVQEKKEYANYSTLLRQWAEKVQIKFSIERWYITWRETATNAVRVGTMFLATWFVIKGQLTPGDLVLVFTLTEKAFSNMHRVGRIYTFLGDAHESLARAAMILKEQNTLTEPLTPFLPTSKGGTIELKNVSFSYTTGESVLEKVNIPIPAKKIVAIIGESGSGKTTLIKLITRHYDPNAGAVYLDGINLRRLALNTLRKKIAVVSQHTEIFNRTIDENIAYGRPHATRREVIKAAKRANAHQFITSFTKGYDTMVGEKGVRLSGGQQQRISIARALLANPEILIFDEATSSLDSTSEMSIQKAIFAARGKYTMIIIAHRLSTIEHADYVVIMHKGQVVEMGVPHELLKKGKSFYKRMRQLQRLGEIRK